MKNQLNVVMVALVFSLSALTFKKDKQELPACCINQEACCSQAAACCVK